MASTATEPYLKTCGLSNKEISHCLALKRDAGILEVFKKLFADSPAHFRTFLRDFDLTWFFKDEPPPFLTDGAAPGEGAEAQFLTNLKLARGVEGLGEAFRSWCGVRRRSLKKAYKKIADETAFRKCFADLQALDEFLLWLFETQLATRGEARGLILEPDDIVAFELNKNLALYADAKDGILPAGEEVGKACYRDEVLPHVLAMTCVVGYIVEGGNFYVGHGQKDRRDFDAKQHRVLERMSALTGKDLRKGVPADLRDKVSARLAELKEPYRVVLELDRCDKYLVYLEETSGENWTPFRKPEPMRKCPACGNSDRWVGHKCEGCRHYFCPACVKKSRGNLCQACADAGVVPVQEPSVREDLAAAEQAAKAEKVEKANTLDSLLASAIASTAEAKKPSGLDSIVADAPPPAPAPVSPAEQLGIVDLGRETVAGFGSAVRAKFAAVRTVDASTQSMPCCGKEIALAPLELSDGKVNYGFCAKCQSAFVSG